jgi:photosystem II stability/assembly factor-like uncharacterized protein
MSTMLSTADGGASWTSSQDQPQIGATPLWTLRCDQGGGCIGLALTGSVADPSAETVEAIRSNDFGVTWTVASFPVAIGPGTVLMSCGDAAHCLMAYNANNGAQMGVATTHDAGSTWAVTAEPTTWPNLAVSVSCASALDCFISANTASQKGQANPVIEATHDGGATWTALSVPAIKGSPLVIVYPMSCPVPAGCMGVGATAEEFSPRPGEPLSSVAGTLDHRVIVSNLS